MKLPKYIFDCFIVRLLSRNWGYYYYPVPYVGKKLLCFAENYKKTELGMSSYYGGEFIIDDEVYSLIKENRIAVCLLVDIMMSHSFMFGFNWSDLPKDIFEDMDSGHCGVIVKLAINRGLDLQQVPTDLLCSSSAFDILVCLAEHKKDINTFNLFNHLNFRQNCSLVKTVIKVSGIQEIPNIPFVLIENTSKDIECSYELCCDIIKQGGTLKDIPKILIHSLLKESNGFLFLSAFLLRAGYSILNIPEELGINDLTKRQIEAYRIRHYLDRELVFY